MIQSRRLLDLLARRRDAGLLLIAMLTMAFLLGVLEYLHLSHQFERDLQTGADIVGRTASAAVVFDSPREAAEILKAFAAMPDVSGARLQRPDGSMFAAYAREAQAPGWLQRHGGQVQVGVDVLANGAAVARLALTADRGATWATLLSMLGGLLGIMGVALAVTGLISRRLHAAVRDAEDRTHFLAHHDSLTGLVNRATFTQALESTVEQAQAGGAPALLLCLDVDNFKLVNDTHGHAAGDQALIAVADRLRALVRDGDPVARLGGDEFAVLLAGDRCEDAALRIVQGLLETFPRRPIGPSHQRLGLSIGIARVPGDARTAADAMHCADVALYQAKRDGKGRHVFYSAALGDVQRQRLHLQLELRQALANGQLQLAYQPIFDVAGRLCSLEALARWQHPEVGWIPPGEFIPVAEEYGLIVELGLALMTRARQDIDTWRARGLAAVPVALNVSALQLRTEDDRQRFLAHLATLRFQPHEVEFELTESVVFEDLHNPDSILVHLQSMGFTLSIDDFGTGYSSLAYLRRMRCRKLKIDRSFVRDIHIDKDNALMVESIMRVAHSLGMLVVAEGVEKPAEQGCLAALGCDLYQGFGLARPQGADAIEGLLGQHRADRPPVTMIEADLAH